MAVGGPVESILLGDRSFPVASDSDPTRDIGGNKNTIEMNGDGTGRQIVERKPYKSGPHAIVIDDDRGDQEYVQDLIDTKAFHAQEITYVDGTVYSGLGQITEEAETKSSNATMEVTLSGPGKLGKQ